MFPRFPIGARLRAATHVVLAGIALLAFTSGLAASSVLDAPERVHLQTGAGAATLTLANITGGPVPEIVGNSTGFSAYTRAGSGWSLLAHASDNFSGFASFEDTPVGRVGLYTNVSVSNANWPVVGAVLPDAVPAWQWHPLALVLGSSNFAAGDRPGRFSHANPYMSDASGLYPPAVYGPVSGNPSKLYLCELAGVAGNGTPTSGLPFAIAPNGRAAVNGFYNVDSRPDVAVACAGTGPGTAVVSLLLRTGPTSFAPHVDYPVADGPVDIAQGHFRLGRPDLVVACADANGVSYLENNGDGTYAPAIFLATHTYSGMRSIHVADVNQDGFDDVVVFYATSILDGHLGGIGVRFGTGNGEFSVEHFTPTRPELRAGAVGDMNGDEFPDAVISIPHPGHADRVEILYGRGDATFGGGTPAATATIDAAQPYQLVLDDLDGDASGAGPTADLLASVPTYAPGPNLIVQPNIVGANPAAVAIDLPEPVFGIATGHFFSSTETPSPRDLIGGGLPPVALHGSHSPFGFADPLALDYDAGNDAAGPPLAADLDGDGWDDAISAMLELSNPALPGRLEWCMNLGDDTFALHQSVETAPMPRQVLAADFDADGDADVVTIGAPHTVAYHANAGAGVLDAAVTTTLSFDVPATGSLGPSYHAPTHVAAAAKLAGPSGSTKLLVLEADPPRVAVCDFGGGAFSLVESHPVAANPIAVAVGDLDGDGALDVAVACEGFEYPDSDRERLLTVWHGDGTGALVRRTDYDLYSDGLMDMQVGDLTGDGRSSVSLLHWSGPRTILQGVPSSAASVASAGGVQFGVLRTFEPVAGEVTAVSPSAGAAPAPRLAIQPNPARARAEMHFAISRGGDVQAEVFDLSGRRVWGTPRTAMAAGPVVVRWDGRTESGMRVSAGLYLVRVSTPDGARQGRVVWLK